MNQTNSDVSEIERLKLQIEELRSWNCNQLADLLCKDLEELEDN